jgi:hypothetical protein
LIETQNTLTDAPEARVMRDYRGSGRGAARVPPVLGRALRDSDETARILDAFAGEGIWVSH